SMADDKTLTVEQVRTLYDQIGSRQDWSRFFEDKAINLMIDRAEFDGAAAIFEFGCGTARIAEKILDHHAHPDAAYLGFDVSPTMAALARRRLEPFGSRAQVRLTNGSTPLEVQHRSFDRFVSTYVFDLLSGEAIDRVLKEAHRILAPEGLLC